MTQDSAVVELVGEFGAAWNAHDLDAALALCTPDVVFESTEPAPDGARHVGQEAVRRAWQPIFDDPATRFTVEEVILAGDRVVQLWRFDWGAGHVRGVDVIRTRDGLVSEKFSYVKG